MPGPVGLWLARRGGGRRPVRWRRGGGGAAGRPCVPHVATCPAAGCREAPRDLPPGAGWCLWALSAVQGVSGQRVSLRRRARHFRRRPLSRARSRHGTRRPVRGASPPLALACGLPGGGGADVCSGPAGRCPPEQAPWVADLCPPSPFLLRLPSGIRATGRRASTVPVSPAPLARARGHFSGGVSCRPVHWCVGGRGGGCVCPGSEGHGSLGGEGPRLPPRPVHRGVAGGGGTWQGGLACPNRPRLPGGSREFSGCGDLVFVGARGGGPGRPAVARGSWFFGSGGYWSAGQKGTPLACAPMRCEPPARDTTNRCLGVCGRCGPPRPNGPAGAHLSRVSWRADSWGGGGLC